MITGSDIAALTGAEVIDPSGEHIGTVGRVVLTVDGGQPLLVSVRGTAGGTEPFVPLQSAELVRGVLRIAYDRRTVAGAPELDAMATPTDDERGTVFDYYDGRAGGAPSGVDGTPAGMTEAGGAELDAAAP